MENVVIKENSAKKVKSAEKNAIGECCHCHSQVYNLNKN